MEIKYSKKSIVLPNGTKRNYYYKTENKNKVRISADVYKAFMKKKKGGSNIINGPNGEIDCIYPLEKVNTTECVIDEDVSCNIQKNNVFNRHAHISPYYGDRYYKQCRKAVGYDTDSKIRDVNSQEGELPAKTEEASNPNDAKWCNSAHQYYGNDTEKQKNRKLLEDRMLDANNNYKQEIEEFKAKALEKYNQEIKEFNATALEKHNLEIEELTLENDGLTEGMQYYENNCLKNGVPKYGGNKKKTPSKKTPAKKK